MVAISASTFSPLFYKGEESNISNFDIQDAAIIMSTDTHKVFLDADGTTRIEVSDFIKKYTKAQILAKSAGAIYFDKIYRASDTNHLYVYQKDSENNIIAVDITDFKVSAASHADSAGTASYATNAGTAAQATNASTANFATRATNADTASYATNAGTAAQATNASTANFATRATNADTASYATNAGTSKYATNAGTAAYATNAGTASQATNASTANFATNAGTAVFATHATTADMHYADISGGPADEADFDFGVAAEYGSLSALT